MFKLQSISLLFLSCFLLGGCARNRESATLALKTNKNLNRKIIKPVYLAVKDIECDDCAQSVLDILTNCQEIDSAIFEGPLDKADTGYLKICMKPDSEFPLNSVKEMLGNEGFTLSEISDKPITDLLQHHKDPIIT